MNAEESKIFEEIKKSLRDIALDDIKKSYAAKSIMGTFILCSCFIDAMAGFRYGQDGRLKLGKMYRTFVEEYLKDYDKVSLYYDLRCQLVHNYSESKSYKFIHDKSEFHLGEAGENKTYINLENFIADLERAVNKLFEDIENSPAAMGNAMKRYLKYGLARSE